MRLSHSLIGLLYVFSLVNTLKVVKGGAIGKVVDAGVLVLMLLSIAVILHLRKVSLSKVFKKKLLFILYVSIFLVIAILSTNSSMNNLFLIFAYVITGILSFQFLGYFILRDQDLFDVLLKTIVYSSLFVSFTALLALMGLNSFLGLEFVKKFGAYSFGPIHATAGILEHPNTWGTILVFTIGSLMYLKPEFKKPVYWGLFGLFCFFLFATFTRGPWVAFIGAYIFMKIYDKIPRWGFYTISVFILLALSFTSVPQISGFESDTVNSLFRVEQGLSGRGVMWAFAFTLIPNQPWLGYGFKSSAEVKELYGYDEVLKYASESAFHNTFITTAVELGLIVGILYFVVFFKSFDNAYKAKIEKRKKDFFMFMTVAILISVMAVDYNVGGLRSVSLLLSIFLGASYQSLKHRS